MKQLLIFLFLLCSVSVSAQDVIVKKDGTTVSCLIINVTATEITYKKWGNLNGSNYVMDKSLVSAINYGNGKKETFGVTENLYNPNNQNNGVQQYNDRALLAMDSETQNSEKSIKRLRTWGWISGIASAGIIAALIIRSQDPLENEEYFYIGGGLLAAGGIACSTYCFVTAHKRQKLADSFIYSFSLFQQEFKFANGSCLTTGIDILSDRTINDNTLGLGLRYNF